MNQQPAVTPKIYFRTLNILFLALAAGQVVFALISTFLVLTAKREPIPFFTDQVMQILFWAVPLLAVAGIVSGRQLFISRMNALRNKTGLSEKLSGYQSSLLIRYAMMEGPCLVALVIFYLTGNFMFLAIAAAVILVFLLNRPSKALLIRDLQLHDDERLLLEEEETRL